jgi:hypothetical protein
MVYLVVIESPGPIGSIENKPGWTAGVDLTDLGVDHMRESTIERTR